MQQSTDSVACRVMCTSLSEFNPDPGMEIPNSLHFGVWLQGCHVTSSVWPVQDERYAHLVGRRCEVPFSGGRCHPLHATITTPVHLVTCCLRSSVA